MNNRDLAALAILPMGIALVFESAEHQFVTVRETAVESYSTTLADNLHIHSEVADSSPTTAFPYFVSGGQRWRDRYALHARPQGNGFQLIGYPRSGDPNAKPQMMVGFSANVDSLIDLLVSHLDLPPAQIDAVRRIALEGHEQQIGGHGFPLLLRRADLVSMGMTFRPLDC